MVGAVQAALNVPVALDAHFNATALAEVQWGRARGVSDFLYVTVATWIAAGAIANGEIVHGLSLPDMGHVRVPHDLVRDPFAGVCPYHGDCLEGLASGPTIAARWGVPLRKLPPDHPAWLLEAHYLALGLNNWALNENPRDRPI